MLRKILLMADDFVRWCKPADIIAVIVLLGAFVLMLNHIDGVVSGLTVGVVTYYFVRRVPRDNSTT